MDFLEVNHFNIIGFYIFWLKNVFLASIHWWWLILPFFLFKVMENYWMYDQASRYFSNNKFVILKINVPREQERSPKLMETILHGMWTVYGNVRNFMDTLVLGIMPDYFSLEIVGTQGKITYGIWIMEKHADFIKSHIYSQYPEAEIEVTDEDYMDLIPDDVPSDEWECWTTVWAQENKGAYPIKTYPEFQDFVTGTFIDPLASYMEVLGNLGPGEHLWYQLLLEPIPDDKWYPEFQQEVEKILDRGRYKETTSLSSQILDDFKTFPTDTISAAFEYPEIAEKKKEEEKLSPMLKLSPGEQDSLKAIERGLSLRSYRAQYSTTYIGRKDNYHGSNIPAMLGAVNQFNTVDLNGFAVYRPYMSSVIYWATKARLNYIKRRNLRIIKNRQFSGENMILNTEEIASLWHFPDQYVKAPHTPLVGSKKAAAPTNLPIERD